MNAWPRAKVEWSRLPGVLCYNPHARQTRRASKRTDFLRQRWAKHLPAGVPHSSKQPGRHRATCRSLLAASFFCLTRSTAPKCRRAISGDTKRPTGLEKNPRGPAGHNSWAENGRARISDLFVICGPGEPFTPPSAFVAGQVRRVRFQWLNGKHSAKAVYCEGEHSTKTRLARKTPKKTSAAMMHRLVPVVCPTRKVSNECHVLAASSFGDILVGKFGSGEYVRKPVQTSAGSI